MKIAIIPNLKKDIGLVATTRLISALKGRAELTMDPLYESSGLEVVYQENLYDGADAAVVLGGDGTILKVANPCAVRDIPILGVNLGRIGFMAEIEPDDIEQTADRLLKGDYFVQRRMMMQIDVYRSGAHQGTYHALNDVVITKSPEAKLIGMELFVNGEKVNGYVADGLILSTPTGSTGYSLSAGGPVVDPMMRLFVASPICAHMLTARPAVLPCGEPIALRLCDSFSVNEATITVDGDAQGYLKAGDLIEVSKSSREASLIKMGSCSFYDVLMNKLS